MTQTPATSQVDFDSGNQPAMLRGPIRAGYPVMVFVLLWSAQLLFVGPVLGSIGQAQMAEFYHTTQITWFSLVSSLVGMLLTPMAIKLGDVYGKRRIMLFCVGIGLVGDVIVATAPTFGWLLFGRALAAFYAPLYGLTFATARDIFPPKRAAAATGAIGGSTGAVLVFTPLFAGWLLDAAGFRALLWLLAGVTAVAFAMILAFVPETPRHAEKAELDRLGALLLGGSATLLVFTLGKSITWGWSSPKFIGMIVLGIVLAVAFVFVERSKMHPLLNVRMYARREVATVLISTSLIIAAIHVMAGTLNIFVTLFPRIPNVSDALGWSATHAALIGIPGAVMMLCAGFAGGSVLRRISPKLTFQLGGLCMLFALLWYAFYHSDNLDMLVAGPLVGLGMGLAYSASPLLVLSSVRKDEQGLASGTQSMTINLFYAFTIELVYVMLNQHAVVLQGTAFYLNSGFRNAYLGLAALVALGLLITLVMPKMRRPGVDTEPADD